MASFSDEGFKAYERGNYSNAIRHYAHDDAIAPNNTTHYYYQLEKYSKALTDAEKAVRMKLDGSLGYRRLGAAHSALQQYDEAVSAYNKGLELFPNNAALKSDLAFTKATLFNKARRFQADDQLISTTPLKDGKQKAAEDDQDDLLTKLKQILTEIQNDAMKEPISSFSVKEALSVLNRMVGDGLIEEGGELWCVATDLFEDNASKREMFISMPHDNGRIAWLKHNITKQKKDDLISPAPAAEEEKKEEPKDEESDEEDKSMGFCLVD